jgi:hypothetical protein
MSHIQHTKVKVTNLGAATRVATQLGTTLGNPQISKVFNASVHGRPIKLPGWRFPIVIQEDGSIQYDNFNGNWGDQTTLDAFLADYSAECLREAALARGESFTETVDAETGDLVMRIETY